MNHLIFNFPNLFWTIVYIQNPLLIFDKEEPARHIICLRWDFWGRNHNKSNHIQHRKFFWKFLLVNLCHEKNYVPTQLEANLWQKQRKRMLNELISQNEPFYIQLFKTLNFEIQILNHWIHSGTHIIYHENSVDSSLPTFEQTMHVMVFCTRWAMIYASGIARTFWYLKNVMH